MAYYDAMELASPSNSPLRTPRAGSSYMETPPPPPYKSNSTVISLVSPDRNYSPYNSDDRVSEYMSQQKQAYNDNDNDSNATQIPDLTEYGPVCQSPLQTSITPLKPSPPRSFERHWSKYEHIPQTLDYMTVTHPDPKPPIKVLLVLTPQPASLMETTAFEALGACFCSDFSGPGHEWSCISLYAHFRSCMAQKPGHLGGKMAGDGEDVGIGDIHPYALREKLEQEKAVQWRLTVPVLQLLIDKEVKKGSRAFVVCGLAVGDVEGVRAFGRTIAEPAGIFAFLPSTHQLAARAVPAEYKSRSVVIDAVPLSQTNDVLLAALYAKQLSSGKAEVVDVAGADNTVDEGHDDQEGYMMDWM